MHIIICLNPDGKNFKSRLQRFPALINYCTVNWFLVFSHYIVSNNNAIDLILKQKEWPDDALQDVAENILSDANLDSEELTTCIALCKKIHADSQSLSERAKLQNISLITPNSYIEFIRTFKKILLEKRR